MSSRRGFLAALAGCAVTPGLAARLLRPSPSARVAAALQGIARRLPYTAPAISGGFLVPPEYVAEIRTLLADRVVIRQAELAELSVVGPQALQNAATSTETHAERRNGGGAT